MRWTITATPAHGRLGPIDTSGHVTYKPKATFTGHDRFIFKATDSEGASSQRATVFLRVAAPGCGKLTGKKLVRCKAALKRAKALKACSHIRAAKSRAACIQAAQRAYSRAIGGKPHHGRRLPPATVLAPPRLILPNGIQPAR